MNMEKQIKMLVIPSWYPPNGGFFFREHAVALAEAGLRVDVLAGIHTSLKSLKSCNILKAFSTSISTFDGITEHTRKYWIIPFSDKPNFHAWVSMMTGFYQSYQKKEGPPDIILAHSSIWAGLVAAIISQRFGIPYIITEHRSRFINNSAECLKMFKPWHFNYIRAAYNGAAKVITVSDALQPFIKQISANAAARIATIPNMVDTGFFVPNQNQKKTSPFVFFSLSNLIPLKGMDTLVEAMALLEIKYPGEFRLTIGGDGPERIRLERMVNEKKLHGIVTITGRLSREGIRENMHLANAFVLASRFEAFGVVYIEAMACGLPVVATRAGGPQCFIRESEGILTNPENPIELAEAMQQLRATYHQFDHDKISSYAFSMFGRANVANQYITFVHEIVKKHQQ